MQTVSIITAIDNNFAIGKDGKLPWLPIHADMAHFKRVTLGHVIIMGRKTFESIGRKPLPGRRNIVVTRQPDYKADGCEVAPSLENALVKAGDGEVFIVGGAEIYREALRLDVVHRIYLTRVEGKFSADTFFPKIDMNLWREVESIPGIKNEKNPYGHTFLTFERISS